MPRPSRIGVANGFGAPVGRRHVPAGGPRAARASSPIGRAALAARRTALFCVLAVLAVLAAAGCGRSDLRLARRILDDHRRSQGARPMAGAQVLQIAVRARSATGSLSIEWDVPRYRETMTSAGVSTVRGIQGGTAYYIDEDGVTRVVSEPILAELVTRSFFWRKAYLFEDAERARLALGPADERTVSLELTPHGGNTLRLVFDRRTLNLVAASSPGLDLAFESASRWRDASRPGAPLEAELRHAGLPSDALRDAAVGGWSASWPGSVVDAPFLESPPGSAVVSGTIAGRRASIAIDGSVDGPVRVRPSLAAQLPLSFVEDVLGRRIASGARLEISGWSEPSVHVEISDAIPAGADAAVGGSLFRETIVEYDTPAKRLRLHDPERWVRGDGYYRCVLDDDGNSPVAILQKRGERVRATAGATEPRELTLRPSGARRLRLEGPGLADGLHWGPAPLPPVRFDVLSEEAAAPDAAAHPHVEGRLATAFFLRFRVIVDLTHRWAYLHPESGPAPHVD